jgi:hypothetical protein
MKTNFLGHVMLYIYTRDHFFYYNSLTAVAPQEGPSISVVGDTYRIVIGSEQSNGTYALIDMLIPPKGG